MFDVVGLFGLADHSIGHPSGTGYPPRSERLRRDGKMKWLIVVRRRKVKHYGWDKYPVRHTAAYSFGIDLLKLSI